MHVDLEPKAVFGACALDSKLRMAAVGSEIQLSADLYRGGIVATPTGTLAPFSLDSDAFGVTLSVRGATATVTLGHVDFARLTELIAFAEVELPALLSAMVLAPVTPSAVYGALGEVDFKVQFIGALESDVFADTSEQISARTKAYFEKIAVIPGDRGRLLAAHRYLQQARRLRMVSTYPGEFLGERILNLYKLLEALFATRKVDDIRPRLRELRVPVDLREAICGIVYVRDQLDSGHIALHALAGQEYELVHRFADRAEDLATWLLQQVVQACADGRFKLRSSPATDRGRLMAALAKSDDLFVSPYAPEPIGRRSLKKSSPGQPM